MRTLPALLLSSLLLTACGSATATYSLSFDIDEKGTQEDLTRRSIRVIERRLENFESELLDQVVDHEGSGTTLTVEVPSQDIADALTEELIQPFNLEVMKEVPAGQGTTKVEGHGEFAKTNVIGEHFTWVEHAQDSAGKGALRLMLSPEGRTRMSLVFEENVGKNLGIFVRNRLISKLGVKTDALKDDIIIRDIPSSEIAEIFADDVNVGLHVTFTPLP